MKDLTARQKQILRYIKDEVQLKGYPPSVREIGEAVGLQSSSSVHAHLRKMEELGHIRRDPTKPRAIELLDDDSSIPHRSVINVPVVGQITAGTPILAVENIEEFFPIPRDFVDHEDLFMLRVKGESMIEAGILDRDFVLVEKREFASNGDIVVAMVYDDEATVKRFYRESDHIRLQPENSSMEPIRVTEAHIMGKVVGVFRKVY